MLGYIIVGILGLAIVGLALLVIINAEIRNYLLFKLSPGYAKNITFVKLLKDQQLVYILGTIHGAHLSVRDYSLWHIKAVIKNLRPDLLLVESRPEELDQDNWADGPIEMVFSSLTAMELGIPVCGMDWWDYELFSAGRSNDLREEKMFKLATSQISNQKRALLITGFSHVPEFTKRFLNKGYSHPDFPSAEKEKLFATTDNEELYPTRMAFYIEKRIKLDKKAIVDVKNPKLRLALKDSVAFWSKFLQDHLTHTGVEHS